MPKTIRRLQILVAAFGSGRMLLVKVEKPTTTEDIREDYCTTDTAA